MASSIYGRGLSRDVILALEATNYRWLVMIYDLLCRKAPYQKNRSHLGGALTTDALCIVTTLSRLVRESHEMTLPTAMTSTESPLQGREGNPRPI